MEEEELRKRRRCGEEEWGGGRVEKEGGEEWGGGFMYATRNVQSWIMKVKVHQCQLSFLLIPNSPCL